MQINPDTNIGAYMIRSYAPNEINIYTPLTEEQLLAFSQTPENKPTQETLSLQSPFIMTNNKLLTDWHVSSPGALTRDDFRQFVDLNVEIVILGTGKTIEFPDPKNSIFLQQHGVGLEVMTTEAACRTYNFLVSDGRKVAGAFFMIKG